ncbi:MAG: tetratricopeptide repeat protein [Terriglobia bacterium]|nr:tetratricopeptide repeat protein [Terriglobia bacterium]
MRNKVCFAVFLTALAIIPCFGADAQSTLPVHSRSAAALRFYRQGIELQGNLRLDEAMRKFRSAVKADPDFAMAWAMIAISDSSPAAAARAREKVSELAPKASEGEQLMIRWVVARGGSNMIAAISAANDLVSRYPGDKFVLYEVGSWYGTALNQWERVAVLQEKALALDPNYAPALNEAGYAYAYQHKFVQAIAAMRRYADVIPNEPNPQDSYAEILRLSGHYEEALTHYREALKILPTFYSSQQGLGDTYALMGDQERARAEYAKCSGGQIEPSVSIVCRQMAAYSYIRENNLDAANKELETFIAAMHKEGQIAFAVNAILAEAFMAKDVSSAFTSFDRAIVELHEDHNMPQAQQDELLARIMAHKVRVAVLAGDTALAKRSITELEAFKESPDPLIQAAWKGGNGAWLYFQKKYEDAISELQDDAGNPFSQLMLLKACQAAGNDKAASELKDSILTLHRLDIDLWLAQQAVRS